MTRRHRQSQRELLGHGRWLVAPLQAVRSRIGNLKVIAWRKTLIVRLTVVNLMPWSGRVTDSGGPVVSLTTHGARVELCHLAIESIVSGRTRPSRLILWVEDSDIVANPPRALHRLQRRGLEIIAVPGRGPHTKYIHAVRAMSSESLALVTADDDVLYPRYWLAGLVKAHREDPNDIVCYRARRISVTDQTSIDAYELWPLVHDVRRCRRNFVTGVSGALYPPKMVRALRERGFAFEDTCASADDVWLNNTALREGVGVRVVGGVSRDFIPIVPAQDSALKHANVSDGRNDVQIAATYTDADRQLLTSGSGR